MLRARMIVLFLLLAVVSQSFLAPLAATPAALRLPQIVTDPPQAPRDSRYQAPAAPPADPGRPKNFQPTLGGCNPSNGGVCAQSGDYPVTLPTGNFWHTFNDISLPGRGPDLHFVRTYNSMPASLTGTDFPIGPLGSAGWTHNYNMDVHFVCDNPPACNIYHFIVDQENASTVEFGPGPTYAPYNGAHATLISDTSGVLIFTRNQSQDKFIFRCSMSGNTGGCASTDPLAGKLSKIVDRNNYTTTLSYTTTGTLSGFLSSVADPEGRTLQMSYGQYGGVWVLTRVQDSTGRHVDFGYDTNHDLRTATDLAGNGSNYAYDTNHQMLTMTDPRQGTVTNTYFGSEGVVIQQTDPLNRTLLFGYEYPTCQFLYNATRATVTDTLGYTTVYTSVCAIYGGDPRIVQETRNPNRPDQATWNYYYDDSQHPWDRTRVQDPYNHVYTASYDSNGNLASASDPLGRTTYYRYNATSDPVVITNTRGVTTTFGYDTHGNLTSLTQPLTATNQLVTTTFGYDPLHAGDLLTVTNPLNNSWTYSHDLTYGYVLTATDPLQHATGYRYDTLGRATTLISPRSASATLAYNAFGDPVRITDTLGYTTVYTYDGNRNLQSIRDSKGYTTTLVYDADNEVTRAWRPDGTYTDTGYDGNGNVITQTNGLGQTTRYGYDSFNRLISATNPLTTTGVYSYDLVGNLTVITNAQGLTTTFGYDNANQLLNITYHDGGITPNVSFGYNALGLRSAMTDGLGVALYSYDSLNRLRSVGDELGATLTYTYDLASNLTTIGYPDIGSGVRPVTRHYNAANQMDGVTDWLNHSFSFLYDADGNLTEQDYPSHVVTTTLAYDTADHTRAITHTNTAGPILTLNYTRDALGQVLTSTEGSDAHVYGYDPLQRLAGDQLSGSQSISSTWGYDGAYEITTTSYNNGVSTTGSRKYNNANELNTLQETRGVTLAKSWSFSYSTTGNRTAWTDKLANKTINYTYDQANRLTNTGVYQYRYNGDGLRLRKTNALLGRDTNFTWDLAEGLPLLLQEQTFGSTTSYVYGPGGELLEQVAPDGSNYYYHADQLGSIRALTNSSGVVQNTATYDAYGTLTANTGSVANPFGYAGEYTDAETGFLYLRARYYDPATQQFLTVDPLLALTGQGYNYAAGSPTNATDPSGLIASAPVYISVPGIGQVQIATRIVFSNRETGLLALAAGILSGASWVDSALAGRLPGDPAAAVAAKYNLWAAILSLGAATLGTIAATGNHLEIVATPIGIYTIPNRGAAEWAESGFTKWIYNLVDSLLNPVEIAIITNRLTGYSTGSGSTKAFSGESNSSFAVPCGSNSQSPGSPAAYVRNAILGNVLYTPIGP